MAPLVKDCCACAVDRKNKNKKQQKAQGCLWKVTVKKGSSISFWIIYALEGTKSPLHAYSQTNTPFCSNKKELV